MKQIVIVVGLVIVCGLLVGVYYFGKSPTKSQPRNLIIPSDSSLQPTISNKTATPVLPATQNNKMRKIKLYYYNIIEDKKIADYIPCEAVLPVDRETPITLTPIQDTINLLLKGELTDKERNEGFSTEFPHPGFKLLSANLKDGILTLEFPEIPSFTTGGSCRVGLLIDEIQKTAKQFPEVKEVKFKPEVFQP